MPAIDWRVIKKTLENIRQTRPLGNTPLKRCLWLHLDVAAASEAAFEVHVMDRLSQLITEQLMHTRSLVGIDTDTTLPPTQQLEDDFSQGNAVLEGWSALYYRYVVLELNWSIGYLADKTYTNPRQINRRMKDAFRRLANIINRHELEVRQGHWHEWLRVKLPPAPYSILYGRDTIQKNLIDVLLTAPGESFVQLVGAPGQGKTALAHNTIRHMIDHELIGDFAWITAHHALNYQALLMEVAQALGYPNLLHLPQPDLETALRVIFQRRFSVLIVDNADKLGKMIDNLNRLESILASGRLLMTTRRRHHMLVPTYYIPLPRHSWHAFSSIMYAHVREKRIPLHGAERDDLFEKLYTLTGANPLAGKLLLSHSTLQASLEELISHIDYKGDNLLRSLFNTLWKNLSSAERALVQTIHHLGGQATREDILKTGSSVKTQQALQNLIEQDLIAHDDPFYHLDPLLGHYVEEYISPTIESHAGLAKYLRTDHAPHTIEGIQELAQRVGNYALWDLWLDFLRSEITRTDDETQRALLKYELGLAEKWIGNLESAETHLEEAMTLAHPQAAIALGDLYFQQAKIKLAQDVYTKAQDSSDPLIYQQAVKGLVNIALHREDIPLLRGLLPELNETLLGVDFYAIQGAVALTIGEPQQAVAMYTAALEKYEADMDVRAHTYTHFRLGLGLAELNYNEASIHQFEYVLNQLRTLGDVFGEARALTNLGAAHSAVGSIEQAFSAWRRAAKLQHMLNDHTAHAYTLYNIADLAWQHDYPDTINMFAAARQVAERYDVKTILKNLAAHPALQK